MTTDRDHLLTALAGAFSLVIALGIGRFLFTPALPDMIAETSLTAISGGYLAAINYTITKGAVTITATIAISDGFGVVIFADESI